MRRKPLFPPPQEAENGKRFRNKGRQSRRVLTVNGRVTLVRKWWHSPVEGSVAPADQVIDAQRLESISFGVREMACRLNNNGTSFDSTADNLYRTSQVRMSGEQLRLVVEEMGRTVLVAQRTNTIPPAFQASECSVPSAVCPAERPHPQTLPGDAPQPARTRIYIGCDGVMVPTITEEEKIKRRKRVCEKRQRCGHKCRPLPPRTKGTDQPFKEFKAITFYDESRKHWHEGLFYQKRSATGATLRREARRLNVLEADERIAVVDGALWIRNELQEQPIDLSLSGLGLDFYHLSENVHRCRRAVFSENDPAGTAWADNLMHSFKHHGYEATWEELTTWRGSLRSPIKRAAATRLLNYVFERREMINYPEFLQHGWDIGSGPTESRCKTSTARLKGRGKRWNSRNAEAVAALTTLQDSGQWAHFWGTPGSASV